MVYITGCPLLDFFLVFGTLLVSAVKRPSVCEKNCVCFFLNCHLYSLCMFCMVYAYLTLCLVIVLIIIK